jgi:hypothetical protein
VLTVAAFLLNVRLALRLLNVPTVHGENVAAGRLLQCITSVLVNILSWLLGYLGILEHFMNSARFLVWQAPSSFSARTSSKKEVEGILLIRRILFDVQIRFLRQRRDNSLCVFLPWQVLLLSGVLGAL